MIIRGLDWWHSSVVRMLVFGRQTFPDVPDLWLTGDYIVAKLYAMGWPTRPTQPFIPHGSVNEYLHVLRGWRPFKRQTRTTYGCMPKSVSAGLACCLFCTAALSVTYSAVEATYAACDAIKVLKLYRCTFLMVHWPLKLAGVLQLPTETTDTFRIVIWWFFCVEFQILIRSCPVFCGRQCSFRLQLCWLCLDVPQFWHWFFRSSFDWCPPSGSNPHSYSSAL